MKYLSVLLIALFPALSWAEAQTEKQLPTPTRVVEPSIPADYRGKGIEGEVVVLIVIDEQGRVSNIEVERSTDRRYEEAVINAVRLWRFEPARENGQPRAVKARLPVQFVS